jgi:hypothetical protein
MIKTQTCSNIHIVSFTSSLTSNAACPMLGMTKLRLKLELILRPTVSRPVRLGAHDQILIFFCLTVTFFLRQIRCSLWREDGSVVCTAITQRSESLRTHYHTLVYHLRLPHPGGPGPHNYIHQEQGDSVIPPGTGFPFCHLLRIVGLRWKYSNPPSHGVGLNFEVRSYFTTDSQSVSMSWCRAHLRTCDQILLSVGMLLSEICGLVSVGLPLWREDGSAICSAITQWSESRRTRNHALLSHLRLPQPEGPGSRIYEYIPQELAGRRTFQMQTDF